MSTLGRLAALICIVPLTGCLGGSRDLQANSHSNVERVTVLDTVPQFVAAVRPVQARGSDAVFEQWVQYEGSARDLLIGGHALRQDLVDEKNLRRLAVSVDAVMNLVDSFEKSAPADLRDVLSELEAHASYEVPAMTVGFAVCRGPEAAFIGELGVRPLLLLNARSPDLAQGPARRIALAQQIFRIAHRWQQPDSSSLGPLANALYRTGASMLAARIVVPSAFEPQILQLPEEQIAKLRAREALIAQELLASLDSAGEAGLARFFDPKLKDPLLPRGAGPFISDRLFQQLAADLASTANPLRLTPTEFLDRARRLLTQMAAKHSAG